MKYLAALIGMFVLGLMGGVVLGKIVPGNELRVTNDIPIPTPAGTEITIMAGGDIMLSRSVLEQIVKRGDYTWPVASIAARLKTADLTIGNLETPILKSCPEMTNRMVFCAPERVMAGLVEAGFDALSVENNHSLNQGYEGKQTTIKLLNEVGIAAILADKLTIREVKGLKIGMLAYDDVSQRLNEERLMMQVASAAAEVDLLIGVMHWGTEYIDQPLERQIDLGHRLVEAGMRIVIGAHPHWTQPVEEYQGGLIFYSLGNLVFDQMWSEETRKGYMTEIKLQVAGERITSMEYELIPVRIYDYGQPRIDD